MTRTDPAVIERAAIEVVSSVLDQFRPRLLAAALEGDVRERRNERHRDNFLSDFDVTLHDHYRAAFAEQLPGFVYLSEEGDPEQVGAPSDLVILVDPLDTSELAVRALNGYTHVLAYSIAEARPLVAVVGDFYHHIDLYIGSNLDAPRAALRTRGGDLRPIVVPARNPGDRLLVTNYNMRPTERFLPLAERDDLMSFLSAGPGDTTPTGGGPTGDRSRIGVDFGSVGLCHVATGATDAFVEFAKGFALWDLLPGQHILECAGGTVTDLDGHPLPWPTSDLTDIDKMKTAMNTRQTFIAAANPTIAQTLATTIHPPSRP